MAIPVLTILSATTIAAWALHQGLTVAALMVLLGLLFRGMIRLGGTTLVAPCRWALVSTLSLLVVALGATFSDAARFAAAATTFCPLMAVLGAKRPQDRGWQWVVGSLWIVLVWPAGQAVLLRSGDLDLFEAWKLFLVGLIALGPLNYLPTRNWLPSLLVAGGQTVLLSSYLWEVSDAAKPWLLPVGVACFLLAATIVTCRKRCQEPFSSHRFHLPQQLNQKKVPDTFFKWLRFRDAYGAFWALRIQSRVNQTAELRRWPMRLDWQGFESSAEEPPTAEQMAELEQTTQTLFRRFM
jgi:hypothetical protein